jgi:hypothetical protein
MLDLACLLISQEIFTLKGHRGPQSPGITDMGLLSVVPCEIPFLFENNILRDLRVTMKFPG